MDTNNRGGFPGFVRLISNEPNGAVLVYPEYSGNRLYQTLGNLRTNPRAGYVIPDFNTGDCLYISGTTEVLFGKDAEDLLPRSNVVVKVTVLAARFVEKSLAFRGIEGEPSPYNPPIRFLRSEKEPPTANTLTDQSNMATLIRNERLTPSVNRFRFRLSRPEKVIAGQYAVFSFKDDLNMGYSHMRDDDPTSINDDYIRTFTVSSGSGKGLPDDEFEITARKHGNVTSYLGRSNDRSGLEVPMLGFGGSFRIEDQPGKGIIPFVAGGIGITPVLAQLDELELSRFRLFWTIAIEDIRLVQDTFERFPDLAKATTLFITKVSDSSNLDDVKTLEKVESSGASVHRRRLTQADLDVTSAETWYLCSGTNLKTSVLNWLTGKKVIYEDFSY
jgi:NAD(P)H-flavin reductase